LKVKRIRSSTVAILCFFALGLSSRDAQAVNRDVRAVMTTATYGLVLGTAAGLVTWPINGNSRGIFIGASVGLYLGIIAGVYFITHRDDPQNPLNSMNLDPSAPPRLAIDPALFASSRLAPLPELARLEISVLRF
jgi:hypothetical protein